MKIKTLVKALALAFFSVTAQAQTQAAPPPSAPPPKSAAELEKLVAPIALYSDPLIATILPASVYPLEIVQAARFVSDTNNLAKLDAQPWDDNVKAVARVPAVIKMMNDDLQWTMALGETFLAQDKDVLDMIQTLRGKAQKAGTLQTTPQQVVVVTNTIVQSTVEQRVVVVTNTIVQIQPVNPQVVYVPVYNPYTVYYPPPTYVPNPYAPLITFGVGIAVGAAIAHNSCDYHSGSVYVGQHGVVVTSGSGYHGGDVHVDHNTTVNNYNNANVDRNNNVNSGNRGNQATPYNKAGTTSGQQKWQPDQKRLSSTSRGGTANTMESRGYGSSSATRPSTQPSTGARPSTPTGGAGARPSIDNVTPRPSTGNTGTRPTTAQSPAARPSTPAPTARPASPSTTARPSSTSSGLSSSSRSGGSSAFGGLSSGSSSRSFSSRGSSSRSSGGFSGGGRSSGGRSGGGGRR